jgi:hypothetical protein
MNYQIAERPKEGISDEKRKISNYRKEERVRFYS